jgi:hypothetical protein
MYLISWEEGAEGLDGLLLARKDKILNIDLPDASSRDPQEINETLLCKKRGTYKNK